MKHFKSLVVLSSLLLLSGCRPSEKPSTPSNTDTETETVASVETAKHTHTAKHTAKATEEETATATPKPKVKLSAAESDKVLSDFLKNVATKRLKVTAGKKSEDGYTEYSIYGGNNAAYLTVPQKGEASGTWKKATPFGALFVQDKGTFAYESDAKGFKLGSFVSLSNALSDIVDPIVKGAEALGKSHDLWTYSGEGRSFVTQDKTLMNAIMATFPRDHLTQTPSKITLTVNEDGTANFYFLSGFSMENINYLDVGTNSDAGLEAFLKNPVIADPTDYSAECKALMANFVSDTSKVPYLKGKFTYANQFFTTQNQALFVYDDLKCGNVMADFDTALKAKGWDIDTEKSDLTNAKGQGAIGYYTYSVSEQTVDKGAVSYVLMSMYSEPDTENPNGSFLFAACSQEAQWHSTTLADINAKLETLKKKDGTNALADLTLGGVTPSKYEMMDVEKQLEQMYAQRQLAIDLQYGWQIVLSIADVEDAYTAATSYANALKANGLTEYDQAKIADVRTNNAITLTLENDKYQLLEVDIVLSMEDQEQKSDDTKTDDSSSDKDAGTKDNGKTDDSQTDDGKTTDDTKTDDTKTDDGKGTTTKTVKVYQGSLVITIQAL